MQDEENTQAPEEYNELEALQNRCNMLGIKFHPKAGPDKLRAKIEAHLNSDTQGLSATDMAQLESEAKLFGKFMEKVLKPMTHAQYLRETTQGRKRESNRLVRIRIMCMNPNKKEWEGEIFSVGSAKLGTFKKYVPFGAEDGYHVPYIIYTHIRDRKYTQYYNARGPRGEKIRKGKLMPEFSVEVLDPLTEEERKELAQRQMMRDGAQAA